MGSNDRSKDEDIEMDFSKFKKFFNQKTVNVLIILILILIPVVLTIYIRLQPDKLVATDAWAQSSVENYYKNQIATQVASQYPNLPVAQRNKLVDDQYAQFKVTNKDQINQQITQTAAYFKTGFEYQENGTTYTFLGDLDSYYYLRQARNLETKGTICDKIVDGVCVDDHMIAPLGAVAAPSMHPYGIVYLYKLLHTFNSKVNLMHAQFLLPTILAVFGAIAAFFIGKRLMNEVAGFFAAMFITLSPLFLTRSLGSDTDIWNIILPLILVWVFIEAYETKTLWKKFTLLGIAGLVTGLFSFAWSGWWYIFDFMLIGVVAYIGFEIIKNYIQHKNIKKLFTKEIKLDALMILAFIVSTAIFVSLFTGFSGFTSAFSAPFQFSTTLKVAAYANLWPNVLTTVAELNDANISTIISQVTSNMSILFSLALLGIVFTLVKREPDFKEYLLLAFSAIVYLFLISNSALNMNPILYMIVMAIPILAAVILLLTHKESVVDVKVAFILMIWFIGMIYTGIKGVRFILLMTPVFSIAVGVAIGYIYQYVARVFQNALHIKEVLSKLIVFLILCLILIAPIEIGIAAGKSYVPSMTKGMWDSLTKIREESKPDAIINSWWDFGHWFKYVADRRVTLDGASQNHPAAHWLGLLLQTPNENETVAILRMLDCGSNSAFDEIDKKYQDTEKSQNVVDDILSKSETDANTDLKDLGFSDAEIKNIDNFTYCTPPEDFLITSEDMVGKAGVWAHFGLWDFDKAYIINEVKPKTLTQGVKLMEDRWNYSEDKATSIYYDVQALTTDKEMNDWIAPWPSYASSSLIPCQNATKDIVYCDVNMGIGSNGQQNVVLERAAINISNPSKAQALLGMYDPSTNARLGENIATWNTIIIANDSYQKYTGNNATFNLALLLNIQETGNTTTYSAVVSDASIIDSTFTKLFYLDGKGMDHFEKFSDTTDITGSRIIVWKVKW